MQKILIWGTGKVAEELCKNGFGADIVGFIETKRTKKSFQGVIVYELDDIWPEYDYIVVANMYTNEIYEECICRGIDIKRMIFMHYAKKRFGEKNSEILYQILGEKNYTSYCAEYGLYDECFFAKDCVEYEKLNTQERFRIDRNSLWPVINDKYAYSGTVENYFWQDLWAARLIHKSGISRHFDIGSRIDGFIAHLLAMNIEVSVIDIREFPEIIDGLNTIVDDATTLSQVLDNSIESMSAMCSLEHFGLGRYGDTIDPNACFKAFDNIQKKLKKGGHLYISVPIGKERLEFNAHRIFYAETILECFKSLRLEEFSCTSQGKIEYHVDIHKYDNDLHNGEWRYGLFHFMKM